eukprot:m.91447 g.91447  ORF g.91447 m.91447 type:complete len:368 (-) comp16490_c0_seq3:496-1599(-)
MWKSPKDNFGIAKYLVAGIIGVGVGIGIGIGYFSLFPTPCEDYTMFHDESLDYTSQKLQSREESVEDGTNHINLVICLAYSNSSFFEAEVLLKSVLHQLPPSTENFVGGLHIHLVVNTEAYSHFLTLIHENDLNSSTWVIPVTIRLWHVTKSASNIMFSIVDKNINNYSTLHSVAQWYRLFIPWIVKGIGEEEYIYLDTDVWLVDNIAVLWGSRNEQVWIWLNILVYIHAYARESAEALMCLLGPYSPHVSFRPLYICKLRLGPYVIVAEVAFYSTTQPLVNNLAGDVPMGRATLQRCNDVQCWHHAPTVVDIAKKRHMCARENCFKDQSRPSRIRRAVIYRFFQEHVRSCASESRSGDVQPEHCRS